MGRTVDDANLLLQAQMGPNPHDPFSTMFAEELALPLKGADLGSIRAMLSANLGSAAMSNDYRKIFLLSGPKCFSIILYAFMGDPDFTHGDNAFEVLRGVNFCRRSWR